MELFLDILFIGALASAAALISGLTAAAIIVLFTEFWP